MHIAEQKILIGYLLTLAYLVVAGYTLYWNTFESYVTTIFIDVLIGLVLWFFYTWTIKFF